MATVVNRATAQPIYSVSTPDYSVDDYIINPDLSLLANIDKKYWKVSGDLVLEMSAQEKSAVDSAEIESTRDRVESNTSKEELKYILAALVKVINVRVPGNPITAAELKTAIRAEIEADI